MRITRSHPGAGKSAIDGAAHIAAAPAGWVGSAAVFLVLIALVSGCAHGGASASPSPIPSTTAGSTATSVWSPTALPSIGAAPAGAWTGIRWINAGSIFPQRPTGGAEVTAYPTVYGWSHGFVGFTPAAGPLVTVDGVASADGLHWTVGNPLDVTGLSGVSPTSVVEGPSGLLAVGRGLVAVCGGPPAVVALWTSADGLTWTRVNLPADWVGATVMTVDGGSNGYVAAGVLKDGVTQVIWLSSDGQTWRQIPLTTSTFGEFEVSGAVNSNGGYVVSGAVRNDQGCGETMVTPSLWWSTDGASWTRDSLPGAVPTSSAWMTVTKISNRALMALSSEWNETTQVSSEHLWVSVDGHTWRLIASPSKALTANILTNGDRGVSVLSPAVLDSTVPEGPLAVAAVADDLGVTMLIQSGDGPAFGPTLTGWTSALGPTGIVVLSQDGTTLWLGVPTAG